MHLQQPKTKHTLTHASAFAKLTFGERHRTRMSIGTISTRSESLIPPWNNTEPFNNPRSEQQWQTGRGSRSGVNGLTSEGFSTGLRLYEGVDEEDHLFVREWTMGRWGLWVQCDGAVRIGSLWKSDRGSELWSVMQKSCFNRRFSAWASIKTLVNDYYSDLIALWVIGSE